MSKETLARRNSLHTTVKKYAGIVNRDVARLNAITGVELTANQVEQIMSVCRGLEYILPIANNSWEHYDNFCTRFNYTTKDVEFAI